MQYRTKVSEASKEAIKQNEKGYVDEMEQLISIFKIYPAAIVELTPAKKDENRETDNCMV